VKVRPWDQVDLAITLCCEGNVGVVRWINILHCDEMNVTIIINPLHLVSLLVLLSFHFDHCVFGDLQWLLQTNGAAEGLLSSRRAAVVLHFSVNL